jgi:hypothetical protein
MVVAGRVAFVLDVCAIKLGELRPTGCAVIVVPTFASPSISPELQLQSGEMPCIIDMPLLVRIGCHDVPKISFCAWVQ